MKKQSVHIFFTFKLVHVSMFIRMLMSSSASVWTSWRMMWRKWTRAWQMKACHPPHFLWRVKLSRRQRYQQPKQSPGMRWTHPASTPAPWQLIWNLRCNTQYSANGEASFLLNHMNLSIKICLYTILAKMLHLFLLQLWGGGDKARTVQWLVNWPTTQKENPPTSLHSGFSGSLF